MNIVYYEPNSGLATTQAQAPDGSDVVAPNDVTLCLVTSSSVKLPGYVKGGKYFPIPSQLSRSHIFDTQLFRWVDSRNLSDFKSEKQATLKKQRDATEFSPFTYNGMVFDGDLDAQRRLSVLVSAAKSAIAAGYSFTKDFTLADNTVVQLNAEDFIGIEMAKLWQVDVAFQEYRLKKAAIEAAATLEELKAITI